MREQKCRRDDGKIFIHKERPSRKLAPAKLLGRQEVPGVGSWVNWANDIYYGTLREYESGGAFTNGPYKVIGITALAEDARHDWREFQQIKNDLCGEEWEAIEMYPAESRLVDTSNRFYLWCFPYGVLKDIGLPISGRRVFDAMDENPPQRPFPEDR